MKSLIRKIYGPIRKILRIFSPPPIDQLPRIVDTEKARTYTFTRLGTHYGGWIIPENILDSTSICYLAGAGEDISFDCCLAQQYGCRIRIVDPTPRAKTHFEQLKNALASNRVFPVNNSDTDFYSISAQQFSLLTFLPVGLADQDIEMKFFLPKNSDHVSCSTVNIQKTDDFFVAMCHRLSTIMSQQGDKAIDLLKMDIEGAEYSVIKDLIKSSLLPRVLLVEFDEVHTPMDSGASKRIQQHVRMLQDAGMACVAVEGCNVTFIRDNNSAESK